MIILFAANLSAESADKNFFEIGQYLAKMWTKV